MVSERIYQLFYKSIPSFLFLTSIHKKNMEEVYVKVVQIMSEIKKPPIGITPKFINEGIRKREIIAAIMRYLEADYKIPLEWVAEYNELARDGGQ